MAADATAARFRPAAPAAVNILVIAAAALTVTTTGVCGVLLLLTRDYQRGVYGAGGCVAALACLAVGFVVARRQTARPIGWLLGWALLTPVAVAGSTLVAAALFHPLRRRVQRAVDRRFNRARYNADLILDAFAARLQDAVDLGTVRDELVHAVHAAFEPAHLSIWIKEP
jgi:hypothetical protein